MPTNILTVFGRRHALAILLAVTSLVTVARLAAQSVPLGGPATVVDDGPNAFGYPAPILTGAERRAFVVGNAFFKDNWVEAPASAAGRDGLGPLFNARSCSACHFRDGRGRPPVDGERAVTGFLLRLGVADAVGGADLPHPVYGGQLQDHAVRGAAREAAVHIAREPVEGAFGDGRAYQLQRPHYHLDELGYGPLRHAARMGARVAPQMIGLGLLEAVTEQDLVARADPEDRDGDGISGRAHFVVDLRSGQRRLGRFGWKATQPTVEQQVAAAFVNDMGITSSLFPEEVLTEAQAASVAFVSGGSPEISDRKLARVTFYSQTLAVPAQRTPGDPDVAAGARLFDQMGCAACHVPELRTGEQACLEAFAGVRFRPYTDLLLHDLGDDLADEKRDGDALPGEWRTPPLWGIGLFERVNGHTHYLHDGRARNLSEAILWHGGEAAPSRRKFREADSARRAQLLAFLRSL